MFEGIKPNQWMTSAKRNQVRPFYWNTNVDEISLFMLADPSVKHWVLREDPEAVSLRFGMRSDGAVFWWNGSVNHTGICDRLNTFWILTGIWKFDDTKFTSNNKYSMAQLERMLKDDDEFKAGLEHLRFFSKDINTIEFSTGTFKY